MTKDVVSCPFFSPTIKLTLYIDFVFLVTQSLQYIQVGTEFIIMENIDGKLVAAAPVSNKRNGPLEANYKCNSVLPFS